MKYCFSRSLMFFVCFHRYPLILAGCLVAVGVALQLCFQLPIVSIGFGVTAQFVLLGAYSISEYPHNCPHLHLLYFLPLRSQIFWLLLLQMICGAIGALPIGMGKPWLIPIVTLSVPYITLSVCVLRKAFVCTRKANANAGLILIAIGSVPDMLATIGVDWDSYSDLFNTLVFVSILSLPFVIFLFAVFVMPKVARGPFHQLYYNTLLKHGDVENIILDSLQGRIAE